MRIQESGPSVVSLSHSLSRYQPSEASMHPEIMSMGAGSYTVSSSSGPAVVDLAVLSMQPRFLLTDTNQRKPDLVRTSIK